MADRKTYHHGDLHASLLAAAEAELRANGIEKFSLRGVARNANVSHSAPAHHFKDVTGLLTELAVIGWQRFLHTQLRHEAEAAPDALEQLTAAIMGYLEFAQDNPELFQLMFVSKKPDRARDSFSRAGEAAYQHLVDLVAAIAGESVATDNDETDVHATWALVHGLSSLMNSGFLQDVNQNRQMRERTVRAIVERYWQGRNSPESKRVPAEG